MRIKMKKFILLLVFTCFVSSTYAANYEYIDSGDYYYINNWGENGYVQVVRKLEDEKVKVRDVYSGEAFIVPASKLLTKAELEREEAVNNTAGWAAGAAVIYCLANPGTCSK